MLRKCLIVCLVLAVFFLSACSSAKTIHINAECGVVMNSVFNKITSEEDCRVQCRNQCMAYDMDLTSSSFIQDEKSGCNSCDCVCR